MNNRHDAAYMNMAYCLAEKALGRASPNPYVGALVVKRDAVLGYGYHEGAGKPHAEIVALGRAGFRAKGATLYVTLEPCIHWGRTPPCIDAVLAAGLKRVVVSGLDANPLVFQKGVRRIRQAGIDVSVGILGERNGRLNESYVKHITQNIPFVILKAALSLDGKMATRKFVSRWISAPPTREYVHLVRGECDALLVGIHTILRDDPLLTVRHPNWPGKKITRVILDAELRLPLRARIFSTLSKGKILVFTNNSASPHKKEALAKSGADVVSLPGNSAKIALRQVLVQLGRRDIGSLLVEGGGKVATSFLEEKLADKVLLSISPRFIGGEDAVTIFGGHGAEHLREALSLKTVSSFRIGEDMFVEGYF